VRESFKIFKFIAIFYLSLKNVPFALCVGKLKSVASLLNSVIFKLVTFIKHEAIWAIQK